MSLVDTHVHVNFDVFQEDIQEVRSRWQSAGVTKLVHSCVTPGEFEQISSICQNFPEMFCSVGLHPLYTEKWEGERTYNQILQAAQSYPKVVAIGETGLDLYKDNNLELQKEVFWKHLEIAHILNKPVIIHCREAARETLEVLKQFQQHGGKITGVMHCWGGNPTETQWFLELGLYISFSGVVTFKNAKTVQASAAIVPEDRLLIETDCPFLAPTPYRGKRNEPAYVLKVAEKLAQIRQKSLEEIAKITTTNACRLFNLFEGCVN
ncbi:MAG: TatD family hydrolase [Geminocystis sp.]|nr:TatD family hydrolase [Geminocystis sp.]HIK36459.1 TatD family hydrolase [Geminocystis sp. M7585_C2015_104]MCS7147603.1 TatD family hydrolase [Geminocystis sp.]MCX8078006.1 TatD family hydrolase [Geminocystis sp.]MDW8115296.1 TatD family hydrolase [Geminocystis sp.]